jgi:hypothetical protein
VPRLTPDSLITDYELNDGWRVTRQKPEVTVRNICEMLPRRKQTIPVQWRIQSHWITSLNTRDKQEARLL